MTKYPERVLVHIVWDAEAEVFVAQSDDVPGLVTEAESFDALIAKVGRLIPELLDLNVSDHPPADIELCVQAEYSQRLAMSQG